MGGFCCNNCDQLYGRTGIYLSLQTSNYTSFNPLKMRECIHRPGYNCSSTCIRNSDAGDFCIELKGKWSEKSLIDCVECSQGEYEDCLLTGWSKDKDEYDFMDEKVIIIKRGGR